MEIYSVVIIGSGPAALTAAVYCGRYDLKTIVIGEVSGGTLSRASEIGNWPGIEKISGIELTKNMINHVKSLGIEVITRKIDNIRKDGNEFIVEGRNISVRAKKVILATGTKPRQLNIPREEEFTGSGISYCNTCDGIYFKDKVVAVVGGGNSGCSSANELTGIASKIHLLCAEPKFMFAEPARIKQIENNPKIEKYFNASIIELLGEDKLEGIKLNDGTIIKVSGVFVEIGLIPNKEFLNKIGLTLNNDGYVIADKKMRTNIPGLFSAGVVNEGTFAQAITSAAEGAIAANTAYGEIKSETNV